MDKLDCTGKTVLVVGGTSGIGNAIACRFRDQGACVHIWGRRPSIEAYADASACDYRDLIYSQVDVSIAENIENHRPPFAMLDTLVLSQGDSTLADGASEYEAIKFAHVLNINLTSFMLCSTKFRPMLAQRRGSIVMLSSMASVMALPLAPAYCASKHAVTGLCRSLALGWARDGIRVNAVGPGVVPSRMAKAITEDAALAQAVIARNPLGRLGKPSEIADAALFLASPMADYITGQTLIVDGGHTLIDTTG